MHERETENLRSEAAAELNRKISFEELEATIMRWLLIDDPGVIKVLTAAVLANRLPGDPLWLFLVAGSGGAKTELISGLQGVKGYFPLSDLTTQTFASGLKGEDKASLLNRLPKDCVPILAYKDFTSVLSMNKDKRHEILGQLREIYDGRYDKSFGTGTDVHWVGKLALIAGVTPYIDKHFLVSQTLGERFIMYRIQQPDGFELAMRAIDNGGAEETMRAEIQEAFTGFIENVEIPSDVLVNEVTRRKLACLAVFCSMARSAVDRDGYMREVDSILTPESPSRLAKQLAQLYKGLTLVSNNAESNYRLLVKVAKDSIVKKRLDCIEAVMKRGTASLSQIQSDLNLPETTTRRTLEDLCYLGILNSDKKGLGIAFNWSFSAKAAELIEKAEINHLKPSVGGVPEILGGLELPTTEEVIREVFGVEND